MEMLGRLIAKRSVALGVVVVTLLLTALGGYHARRVGRDDDLLAFLPKGNTEVAQFDALDSRFGGTNVALVGIPVDDPFDAKFLEPLRAMTKALEAEETVGSALSLTNVEDFSPDPSGGIRTEYLVQQIPENDEQKAELREKVMSRDQVVDNLISADGKAITIYAFAAPDADPRAFAGRVRAVVDEGLPGYTKYWGGAPFISTYIYDVTQQDMQRLIPWAVVVLVLIVILSFRDPIGSVLALLATGMGVVMTYGLMGWLGVDANIVLSSMPVILFAVGSAYAVHVMVRYYTLALDHECAEAISMTLREIGPPVLGAGLTTVVGLGSYVAMDITPIRSFGVFAAIGIFLTLVLSLTFVPAVVRLAGLKGRRTTTGPFAALLATAARGSRRHRWGLLAVVGVVVAAASITAGRVQARMENSAFFEAGSPPDRAETFLRERFGGSQFLQVEIAGDMNDPDVLREVQRTADRLALMPHVSSVAHIGKVLELGNESMSGERRLPDTAAQAAMLYRVLAGKDAIRQLVTDGHDYALLNVRIDTDRYEEVSELLAEAEAWMSKSALTDYQVATRGGPSDAELDRWQRDLVLSRIVAGLRVHGVAIRDAGRASLEAELAKPKPSASPSEVEEQVTRFLRSDESILEDSERMHSEAIAAAVVALGRGAKEADLQRAVASAMPEGSSESLIEDIVLSVSTPLKEAWRKVQSAAWARQLVQQAGVSLDEARSKDRAIRAVASALLDLERKTGLVPAAAGQATGRVGHVVSGQPVLYRGLSVSVTANQFRSLALSLGLVLVILCLLFRSIATGLLASAPMVVTLLVVYGVMGARGIHLDIGTSMLASIIIGAGVDYAVHLLAAWRAGKGETLEDAAGHAAMHAGPAIWTNALMVAAGFFVLTLGQARPLQLIGGLTSTAMVVAGLATFLTLPLLARRAQYGAWSANSHSPEPQRQKAAAKASS